MVWARQPSRSASKHSLKDEKAERSASKHNLKDEKAEPMAPEDTAAEGEKGETDPCGYAMERLLWAPICTLKHIWNLCLQHSNKHTYYVTGYLDQELLHNSINKR
jgi:hypothetical protein